MCCVCVMFVCVCVCTLINLYGSTEVAADVTAQVLRGIRDIPAGATNIVPIGTPIKNCKVSILDPDSLLPCKVGETGELFVTGDNLAEGYWNDSDKTAEKFMTLSYEAPASTRFFRTGDFGYQKTARGSIYFVGRRDQQVKVRGHRVECMEVESLIKNAPGVDKAVVLASEENGTVSLYAFFTVIGEDHLQSSGLISWCHNALPSYMVPSMATKLDSLPLLPNGKVDRKSISDMITVESSIGTYQDEKAEPLNPFESYVADVWRRTLKLQKSSIINPNDSFILLGGNCWEWSNWRPRFAQN